MSFIVIHLARCQVYFVRYWGRVRIRTSHFDENIEFVHVRVCVHYIVPDWILAIFVGRLEELSPKEGIRIFVERPAKLRKGYRYIARDSAWIESNVKQRCKGSKLQQERGKVVLARPKSEGERQEDIWRKLKFPTHPSRKRKHWPRDWEVENLNEHYGDWTQGLRLCGLSAPTLRPLTIKAGGAKCTEFSMNLNFSDFWLNGKWKYNSLIKGYPEVTVLELNVQNEKK